MSADFAEALENKDYTRALGLARKALASDAPEDREQARLNINSLAVGLLEAKQFTLAAEALQDLCEESPEDTLAHYHFAVALFEQDQFERAKTVLRTVLDLRPHYPHASSLLIRTHERLNEFEGAVAVGRKAMAARPTDRSRGDRVRGLVSGGVDDATIDRWLDAARTEDREEINLRGRISFSLLRAGYWSEAWPFYADRRVLAPKSVPILRSTNNEPLPEWHGRIAKDHGVIFRCEQGLGDTIMFSRFASLVGAMGVNVLLMAQAKIVRLLSGLPHIIEILPTGSTVMAKNLEWRLLMDLPAHFGITPETIPCIQPYITAEPDRIERWRDVLPRAGFNVGIAWQGSAVNETDSHRSIPLAVLAPLANIPGVNLISLQIGEGTEQIDSVPFGQQIIQPGADFDTGPDAFLDTAGLMSSLDLVVTCDSAVAHVAGALSRPAFLALCSIPDWRWLYKGANTSWYPSMRLFRQTQLGDWRPPIAEIADAITERLTRHPRH